jgi:TolB-like protein
VLPFANMSSDPEQEFFADGIAEDVITALSRYPSLFVIARNSCFTYKGRAVDMKQVGRELGVRYVLEGGRRKSGSRIRVTAQLVEAETGSQVWAARYDRDLADIFAVQDEITEAVTIAIALAIADAEQQRAMRKPPGSLDAWAAYQRRCVGATTQIARCDATFNPSVGFLPTRGTVSRRLIGLDVGGYLRVHAARVPRMGGLIGTFSERPPEAPKRAQQDL